MDRVRPLRHRIRLCPAPPPGSCLRPPQSSSPPSPAPAASLLPLPAGAAPAGSRAPSHPAPDRPRPLRAEMDSPSKGPAPGPLPAPVRTRRQPRRGRWSAKKNGASGTNRRGFQTCHPIHRTSGSTCQKSAANLSPAQLVRCSSRQVVRVWVAPGARLITSSQALAVSTQTKRR